MEESIPACVEPEVGKNWWPWRNRKSPVAGVMSDSVEKDRRWTGACSYRDLETMIMSLLFMFKQSFVVGGLRSVVRSDLHSNSLTCLHCWRIDWKSQAWKQLAQSSICPEVARPHMHLGCAVLHARMSLMRERVDFHLSGLSNTRRVWSSF